MYPMALGRKEKKLSNVHIVTLSDAQCTLYSILNTETSNTH